MAENKYTKFIKTKYLLSLYKQVKKIYTEGLSS